MKPLIGIDEKPVVQEPRQLTSPTQPFPRGDAFVPQEIDIARKIIRWSIEAAFSLPSGRME